MSTWAVTGHRPQKLGGHSALLITRLVEFARLELQRFDNDLRPTRVFTGMAVGWDQAVAQACRDLGIPYVAVIPFENYDEMWPAHVRARYSELCSASECVHVVCEPRYAVWKLHHRNQWLVSQIEAADDTGRLLALWSGVAGGTATTVEHARERGVIVDNCWERWQVFCAG